MTARYEPIDRDWIAAHGGARFTAHLNMGGIHVLCHDVVDKRDGRPIGLGRNVVSYKRTKRNAEMGGRSERVWIVHGIEGDCRCLDEALEALDLVRAAAANAASSGEAAGERLPLTKGTHRSDTSMGPADPDAAPIPPGASSAPLGRPIETSARGRSPEPNHA